jgi:hypothetical protein
MDKKCVVCKKASLKHCSKCKQTYYCGKEHQVSDWKNHKEDCLLYRALHGFSPAPTQENKVVYTQGYCLEFGNGFGGGFGSTVSVFLCSRGEWGCNCEACVINEISGRIEKKTGALLVSARKMHPDEVYRANPELDPIVDEACMSKGIFMMRFPPLVSPADKKPGNHTAAKESDQKSQ